MAESATAAPDAAPGHFREHGYSVIEEAISARDAARYTRYALMNRQHPDYYLAEPKYRAVCRYGDVMGEALLAGLQPQIERATGIELLPCYSFLRIYTDGAVLERHLDRPACEVSATLTLGGKAQDTWPIWLKEGDDAAAEERAVVLPPGNLLVYRGCRLEHWRERLDGEFWVQLFLHYVTANGGYTHHRFDGRRGLGEPQNRQQQDRFIELRREYDAALRNGAERACFCHSGENYSACHGRFEQTLAA